MRRLQPHLVILPMVLLVACGGGAVPGGGQATNAPTAAAGATEAPEEVPQATDEPSGAATTVIPADCAKGLGDYLVAIEPSVAKFDPAKDTLAGLYKAKDAAHDKGMELLDANDNRATYSCSEVGLEFAYFDSSTPWDAVLVIAAASAPGTVAYLKGLRDNAALDEAKLADYGIDGCDAAVSSIKKDVKAQSKKVSGVDKLDFEDGIELYGRYKAYMHDVQDEKCPRDELGNDEFMFMSGGR
jgi:hypothetical protein